MARAVAPADRQRDLGARIVAAAVVCVSRWGVTKTTLDDVAREAGCSRATVYRAFPGGKDVLLLAVAAHEVAGFLADLDVTLASADSLEDALVVGLSFAGRTIREHPALRYLALHEREVLAPFLTFDGLAPLLADATACAAPHLERFVDGTTARRLAELGARLVALYGFGESPAVDLADPASVRDLVRTFVLPAATPQSLAVP